MLYLLYSAVIVDFVTGFDFDSFITIIDFFYWFPEIDKGIFNAKSEQLKILNITNIKILISSKVGKINYAAYSLSQCYTYKAIKLIELVHFCSLDCNRIIYM